ncbi:hypothetical protein FJY93_01275 [Candidatus Kaiserbacteria bacterium]|nr:hypothetical protein [Candidatus Kaiserbacteria bacterium]
MGVFATIIFAFSLAGIVFLFAFKAWEIRRGLELAPNLRQKADQKALRLKSSLMNSREEAAKIVPLLGLLSRYLIHEGALGFARAAHFSGVQAHRLADFVSYKHRFERQAPRSTFLKQVAGNTSYAAPTPFTASPSPTHDHPAIHMSATPMETRDIEESEPIHIIEAPATTHDPVTLGSQMKKVLGTEQRKGTAKKSFKKTSRSRKVEKET